MTIKNLSIDLSSLKPHHYIFSLEHGRCIKSEGDPHKHPFEITFTYPPTQVERLVTLFKKVLFELKIEKYYQELLAFYPIIQECFYECEVDTSSKFNGVEYLNYLIKLLEFKENIDSKNISIEISSELQHKEKSPSAKFVIPPISDLNIFLFDNLVDESLKNAKYASFSLRVWLHSIPNHTLESLKRLKNTLPKIYYSQPTLNEQIAYVGRILIGYLNQIGLKNIHNDAFHASTNQALLIQNYLTLFGLLPGVSKPESRSVLSVVDTSFHQNLNNGLKSLKRSNNKKS